MCKEVIIIGAGGHGKVIADIILNSGDKVIGFLDDNPESDGLIGIPARKMGVTSNCFIPLISARGYAA